MRYVLILLLCVTLHSSSRLTSAWDLACEWSQYSCEGVDRPRYIIGMPAGMEGYRGYYTNGNVFLNKRLIPGPDLHVTAIHETVHHLQAVVAGHPSVADMGSPEMELLCTDEEEAFSIGDRWWRYVGRPDDQRGETWWHSYRHCYQYYDKDWEKTIWHLIMRSNAPRT